MFFWFNILILLGTVNCSARDLPVFVLLRKYHWRAYSRGCRRGHPLYGESQGQSLTRLVSKMSLSWTPKIRVKCCHSEEPGGSSDSHVSHQRGNGWITPCSGSKNGCIDSVLATCFPVNIWTPLQWYIRSNLSLFFFKWEKPKILNTTFRLKKQICDTCIELLFYSTIYILFTT